MEVRVAVAIAAWLAVWAIPAAFANGGMARRRHRGIWRWAVAGILCGWLSSLVLARLAAPGQRPRTAETGVPRAAARTEPTRVATEARVPGWVNAGSWSGNGFRRTDLFLIERGPWRVVWTATGSQPILGGMMQALLYRENGTPVLNPFLPNTTEPARGVADFDGEPGRYYMLINAAGLDWEVAVHELR